MKRINLKTITNALSKKEMMQFRGGWDPEITEEDGCLTSEECGDGSGGGGFGTYCAANQEDIWSPFYRCFYDAPSAAAWAGANGWWCCNCYDALICKSILGIH